ncbi:M20/M25/M40 family metallo-hydrolase [Microbacterium jiangjiandongii]|uniref:M20/M25/M40 family metallo-hydrolase n=1 Tax=Microbacterium jiangjiandongii TaxID=3049071 RepID=UPI00214CD9DE|nr:M20/M25/M40 family metallo-hydrolase [Microbacterium sp. zg.Y843]MCR2816393.1 M20/M25/M40 family metallo-hydrolase [Microbacterium sp. zg.Y843]
MDIASERETALGRLESLVRIESPSLDVPASEAIADLLGRWWQAVGARVRTVRTGAGVTFIADLDGAGAPALLVGHGDTVWPRGTLETDLPWTVDGDTVRGPGVYDMKSGLVVMIAAAERLAGRRHRAVRVVVVCDEEIGSPTTQDVLRDAAEGAALAIGFESPHPDGALKVGRRGSTRLKLTVRGRAAHAALDPHHGVSAIDELVDQLVALRRIAADPQLATEVLCNVGAVRGGGRTNVVPAEAEAEIGLRFVDPHTEERVLEAVRGLQPIREDAAVEWTVLSRRPAWQAGAADEALLARIARRAEPLGQQIEGRPAAGAGDTNQVGNFGVPTVDGFGPRGGGAHALSEHVLLSSLEQRIDLLEAVLLTEEQEHEHP